MNLPRRTSIAIAATTPVASLLGLAIIVGSSPAIARGVTIASNAAPGNTAFPTLSGTAQVGQTLTAATGTWTGTPAPTYSYRWQRCETASVAGVTWTSRTSAADNVWRSVTWGGPASQQAFVAVAQSGAGDRVMTSPDGATWTSQASAANSDWLSVAWGGPAGQQKFVAVAQSGAGDRVMTSPDGVIWTLQTAINSDWTSVIWAGPAGQEKFVAVARGGTNRVMTSPDGVTWTAQAAAAAEQWRSVAWGGPAGQETYVAVARTGTGQRVMTSPDGVTWTLRSTPADIDWRAVTWGGPAGGESFVAVARDGTAAGLVMTSPDGVSWTLRQAAAEREWQSVTWGGPAGQERFVAVGEAPAGTPLDLVMTSRDGITWVPGQSVGGNEWAGVTWGGPAGGESFVAVGAVGTGNRVMTSAQAQCADIPSATSSSYTAQPPDQQKYLRVQVTASNGVAPDGMAYSDPSGQVAAAGPQADAASAVLSARVLPQRTRLVSGQQMRLGIRARNTGAAGAESVTSCVRLPANLVVVRKGSALRSGRTLCFRLGDIAAGAEVTRVISVRAASVSSVPRRITGTARAGQGTRVSAPVVRISIRPRQPRMPVAG